MKNKIVKAEMLWTRKCALRCEYCNMHLDKNEYNTPSIDQWKKSILELKKLDCGFMAFYGAEPLLDFEKLPPTIQFAEENGIHTTVITSGIVPDFEAKIKILYEHKLRSLSMSYDMVPIGKSSTLKTNKALKGIELFKSFGEYRDVALIATLTKTNFKHLPDTIKFASDMGAWVFFDIIHPSRGQRGSKCKNYPGIEELLFSEEDYVELKEVLEEVLELKKQGYLCHTSDVFIKTMSALDFDYLKNYSWNCANFDVFPSWVTIDRDGVVYCCDDFNYKDDFSVYAWELADRFDEFKEYWKNETIKNCPGCAPWNTHLDAHAIKEGVLSFSDYVHTED